MVLWLVLYESQLKLIYRDRKHLLKNIFFKICAQNCHRKNKSSAREKENITFTSLLMFQPLFVLESAWFFIKQTIILLDEVSVLAKKRHSLNTCMHLFFQPTKFSFNIHLGFALDSYVQYSAVLFLFFQFYLALLSCKAFQNPSFHITWLAIPLSYT